jgi:AcrR family transcriptional regulator
MKRPPPGSADGAPAQARRRGRPRSIDSEQLLSVAREVFLERGIRATTLEVALRAKVSEGALFHRFKNKEGLFRAAMELPAEQVPELLLEAVQRLHDLELREALLQLASALLDIGKVALPLMMMSWSNPSGCDPTYDDNHAKYQLFLKRLAMFFETQMRDGKLRNMDAEIIARAFLGSIHHYCMTRILTAEHPDAAIVPEGMFARGLVDLLLNGALLAPETTRPSLPLRRGGAANS